MFMRPGYIRKVLQVLAFCVACLCLSSVPAEGKAETQAAAPFKVVAFYSGTYDAAHIDFTKEANAWFPTVAAQNNFTYTSTNNWNNLNASYLAQFQVVLFLDDIPQTAAQRTAFQQYVENGGGFFGFHVSAFTTDPNSWSWYHNTFLGTGGFKSNTWGPTTAVLKVEDRSVPPTASMPATFTSSVSEWYAWNNDLRNNANIKILASVDPSSFPLGSDPNQQWKSGYYPIMWTNKNYKMVYANFGHNAMNYTTNTRTSSTFASATQNKFLIDSLVWLGGGTTTTPPADPGPISPTAWYGVVNKANGKCVDSRSAASANGTAIQQYSCNSTLAQQFQFQPTSGGYVRANVRLNAAQAIDVTNVSTADNAGLQLWAYSGGNNQQWLPVDEGGGYYHFVNRNSGKCLNVPSASTADSVQLSQFTCNGTGAQSFRLTAA
ncbi:MAG: hypothetical protein QOI21_5957 [Actinomycetota bacterium]|jgi:hypothetical protein|nr:hypothetical protein [Actinomycetota bacterium]